ncbi:hypothetical protein SAMN04515619_11691 [Collimonas sp. OK412]|nr:hypothetical protein SAMN04515619_11691 [Collimonas sp. OK412]
MVSQDIVVPKLGLFKQQQSANNSRPINLRIRYINVNYSMIRMHTTTGVNI